jgi:hypothetical protein
MTLILGVSEIYLTCLPVDPTSGYTFVLCSYNCGYETANHDMRNFVLVTATCTGQNGNTKAGNGIRKLKRGIAIEMFVEEYLVEAVGSLEEYQLLDRDGTWIAIQRTEGAVYTWTFTPYPEDDLIAAVSHLTRAELLRDLKELLPLKALE